MLRLPAVYNDEEGIVQTPPMKFKTLAIHSGHNPLDHHGAVMTPIYQTSTFAFRGVNRPGAFEYSRSGNPTRKALETCLASLEGGAFGFAFATGMAAETTVVMMLEAGNRIIVHSDLYGGTFRLFEKVFRNKGIEAVYVDLRDLAETERELARGAAAVWIESPTNPLMNLVDLRAMADLTHRFGAIAICDNTFLSPYFQRPLELGVDIVVHSTTKYINGHSDVVGGAVITNHARWRRRSAFYRTRPVPVPDRRTASWCCAASRPSPSGWRSTTATHWRLRAGSKRGRR